MKSKRKEKMAKSSKTRFSDLTPKKDARGGRLPRILTGVHPTRRPFRRATKHRLELLLLRGR